MKRNGFCLMASTAFAALFCGSSPAHAQSAGNAFSFAIVGGQAVAANGVGSIVNGNVGINPTAATGITGFPASASVTPPFSVRGNDGTAIAASQDALALYNSAAMAPGVPLTGTNLSISGPSANGHYVPGKYTVLPGVTTIPTNITLDGAGVYIFTVASALIASVGSTIILNGADPCNVWWRVPSGATLDGAFFVGTVVSDALIALGTNATVVGRALTTANGSVTLAGNDRIGGCSGAAAAPTPVPPGSCPTVAPTITSIPASQAIPISGSLTVGFTISGGVISEALGVTATSSDSTLVPQSAMVITRGAGGARVLTLTGADGRSGTTTIAITVTDPGSGCTAVASFQLLIGPIAVPTLPQWGLISLMALMALAGAASLRRRGAR